MGRVTHAYLFTGPRGVGKTSTARIFAKALNCQNPVNAAPCGECSVNICTSSTIITLYLLFTGTNFTASLKERISSTPLSLKAQDEPSHSVSSKEFISAAAWF